MMKFIYLLQHSTPLTATLILASTVLVVASSLALITATLFVLTHLSLPQTFISITF